MTLAVADARHLPLLAGSVQCVVTSPPYWGLRDYSLEDGIGLESSLDAYIQNIVDVFRQIRSTLRDDGTVWLNLGDMFAGANYRTGLKQKDLIGLPWRVAFALQADGWYLRNEIIWAKRNPMPESIRDRLTKSHETIFLLTKKARYYFDQNAIKEPAANAGAEISLGEKSFARRQADGMNVPRTGNGHADTYTVKDFRNKRDVWFLATQPFPKAHFATFPEALVEPCVLAGAPEGGVVLDPFCGSGTVGVVCARNHRRFVGLDLNPEYLHLAKKRLVRS